VFLAEILDLRQGDRGVSSSRFQESRTARSHSTSSSRRRRRQARQRALDVQRLLVSVVED
jgi:hypothetical protein